MKHCWCPPRLQAALQIVRQDLIGMEEELLKMLFPTGCGAARGYASAEKQP